LDKDFLVCFGRTAQKDLFDSDLYSPYSVQEKIKIQKMIFLTQVIYVKEGQEDVFHQFEDIAIPAIAKYNGRLLIRIRPDQHSIIEESIGKPYEIHLVEFDTEQDFLNFQQDEERKRFLYLKDQSVKLTLLFKGTKL
jgi:uncharacterized protein (DUF1330 family)